MATTVERKTIREDFSLPAVVISTASGQPPVLAGQKILAGTVAMLVSGKVRAAASGVAGSVLLGVAVSTYDATGAVDLPFDQVYERGAFYLDGLAGDLPTAANIGGLVALQDNCTVKATIVANDLQVKLLEIKGNQYKVVLV